MLEQRNASAAGIDSTVGESSPPERKQLKEKTEENFEPLGLNIQVSIEGESRPVLTPPFIHEEFHIEGVSESAANVEHQFIPSFAGRSLLHQNNKQETAESKSLVTLRNRCEEISVSLQLGEPEPKRRKQYDSLLVIKDQT